MKTMRTFRLFATAALAMLSATVNAATFYAINEGDWNDPQNWTINADGATFTNPDLLVPGTGDNVVIGEGKIMSLNTTVTELGDVTIIGTLDLAEGITFGIANGNKLDGTAIGKIKMHGWCIAITRADNLFSAKGEYVFKGGNEGLPFGTNAADDRKYIVYNNITVESGATLTLGDRTTINGKLTVRGTVVMNNTGDIPQDINNIEIAAGGVLRAGDVCNADNRKFSLRGNLTCNGELNLCSNTETKPAANAGLRQLAIHCVGKQNQTISFGGNADQCTIYQIVLSKDANPALAQGENASVHISSSVGNKVKFRQYSNTNSGTTIKYANGKNSTLILGENIVIDKLGEGFNTSLTGDNEKIAPHASGAVPANFDPTGSFLVPVGSKLNIAGASVSLGSTGNKVGYMALGGELKIISGSLTTDDLSHGIVYYGNAAKLEIEGGDIITSSVYPLNDDVYNSLVFKLSNGKLSLTRQREQWWYGSLYINEHGVGINEKKSMFSMTGGEIEIGQAAGQDHWCLRLLIDQKNQNVTGGKLLIKDANVNDKINTNVAFYNVEFDNSIINFAQSNASVLADYLPELSLTVKNDLVVKNGANLKNLPGLTIGGNFTTTSAFVLPTDVLFNGTANAVITDNSGSGLVFQNLTLNKANSARTLTIAAGKTLKMAGNLVAQSGTMNGAVQMNGASQTITQGANGSFSGVAFSVGSFAPIIATDVVAKSFTGLSKTKYLDLGNHRLTLTEGSYTHSAANEYLFVTNGNACGGGLALPITSGATQYFPIAVRNGASIDCAAAQVTATTGAVGMLCVEPNNGGHNAVKAAEIASNDALNFFWRLSWNGTSRGSGMNILFHHLVSGLKTTGNHYICYFHDSEWKYGPKGKNFYSAPKSSNEGRLTVNGFNNNPVLGDSFTADITYAKKQQSTVVDTYYSVQSGNWEDASTWSTDSTDVVGNSVPGTLSSVVIRNGHAVTLQNAGGTAAAPKTLALDMTIRQGGTLDVLATATHYKLEEVLGDGKLRYEYNGNLDNWIVSDYTSFCASETAEIGISYAADADTPAEGQLLPLCELPNFSIRGGIKGLARFTWASGQTLAIAGNFVLDNADFRTSGMTGGEEIEVGKNLTLQNDATFDKQGNSSGILTVHGNISNLVPTATLRNSKGLRLYGNLTNKGTCTLYYSSMPSIGLELLGGKNQTISGAGSINTRIVNLKKDAATNEVHIDQTITSSAPLQLGLTSGKLFLEKAGATWNVTNIGGYCLDILENATLVVSNGTLNVANYRQGTEEYKRLAVWLCGGLELRNGATVNTYVNQAGINCGIGYWNTGRSSLRLLGNSTLNTAYIAPVDAHGATLSYYQGNSTVNIMGGINTMPVAYSPLDIRGGVFHTEGTSLIDIKAYNNTQGQTNDNNSFFFNYQPTESNLSANTTFKVTRASGVWSRGRIYSDWPLANLECNNVWLGSPLTVNGNLMSTGRFDAAAVGGLPTGSRDLTIKGNAHFGTVDQVDVRNSKVTIAGTDQVITTNTAATPLKFFDLEVNASGTVQMPYMQVENNMVVNSGDVQLAAASAACGNVTIEAGASVAGATLEMNGTAASLSGAAPRLKLLGTLGGLKVNVVNQINAAVKQDDVIRISETIDLVQGHLNIGVNELFLGKNTQILSPATPSTSLIVSAFDQTSRGISCELLNKQLNRTLPLGRIAPEGSIEYMPVTVSLNEPDAPEGMHICVKPFATRHITLAGKHNANDLSALDFYWTIAPESAAITTTTGYFTVELDKSHARNFSLTGTDSYKLLALHDGEDSWRVQDDGIEELAADRLRITFPMHSTGDFTIATDASEILTYISIANGNAFGAPIWKKYHEGAAIGDALSLTRDDCLGVNLLVNNNVVVNQNQLSPFRLEIRSGGVLDLGETVNHNLNRFVGNGRLRLAKGQLPSAKTHDFYQAGGGTVEFYAASQSAYSILSTQTSVNNLVINGVNAQLRRGEDFRVIGNLNIEGNANLVLTCGLLLDGNLTVGNTSQITEDETGEKTIVFQGSAQQVVTAPANSIKANIEVNGNGGILLSNALNIFRNLTLTRGNVVTAGGDVLTIQDGANIIGGSAASYVDGPLSIRVSSGLDKTFPVGNAGRYGEMVLRGYNGAAHFTVTYFNQSPGVADLLNGMVLSNNEYWQVTSTSGATVYARPRWDAQSNVTPSDVRIAVKKGASDWQTVGLGAYTATSATSGFAYANAAFACNDGAGTLFTFAHSREIIDADNHWTGAIGKNWFDTGNWSKGRIPNNTEKVVISPIANLPQIPYNSGSVASVKDIEIATGATLTIEGGRLTMTGDLIADDHQSFIVNHLIGNAASIVTSKTITGVKVRRQMQSRRTYYVASANATGVIDNADRTGMIVKNYAHDTEVYTVGSTLNVGTVGKADANATWWFEQTADIAPIANKTHNMITRQDSTYGWYLLANESPVAIDVASNIAYTNNISPVVWIRTTNASNQRVWSTYNIQLKAGVNMSYDNEQSEKGTPVLAPYQAFFMKVNNGTAAQRAEGQVTIKPNATHRAATLKSVATPSNDVLHLQLEANSGVTDEVALVFRYGGSLYPTQSDATKIFEDQTKYNAIAVSKEGQKLAIASLPAASELFDAQINLSVATVANATEATICAYDINLFDDSYDVFLFDRLNNVIVSLRDNGSYTFEPSSTDKIRFALLLAYIGDEPSNEDTSGSQDEEECGKSSGVKAPVENEVVETTTVGIAGNAATSNQRGVVIEVNRYTDGTKTAVKKLRK